MTDVAGPHFGLFIPQMRMPYEVIEERVRVAEEVGFHSVWLYDHIVPPGLAEHDSFEATTLAGVLAGRTSAITIGHAVLCNEFRHPSVLAKMAVTLDHASGGRYILGIGWGSVPAELPQFGFGDDPPAVRSDRLRESLEIVELLWSGEPVTYQGRHYQLRDAIQRPRPRRGRIPIMIGGGGQRYTMPLVERFADWWNVPAYAVHRMDELRPLSGGARLSAQHPIGLVTDPARYDETVAVAERRFGYWGGLIAGSPEEVAAGLAADARAGVELFILMFCDFAPPQTLACFAREVIPSVRAAVGAPG